MLQGYIDRAEGYIAGWAFDPDAPEQSVDLGIYVAGKHVADVKADQPRPDLDILQTGFNNYGFSYKPSFPLHPHDVVFARSRDGFIVQSVDAMKHHLSDMVSHPWLLNKDSVSIETEYVGSIAEVDHEIGERIVSYLRRAASDSEDYGPLWGYLMRSRHRDLIAMAEEGDVRSINEYMSEIGRRDLAFGFFDGPDAHAAALDNVEFRRAGSIVIVDRLLSLAEAIGCRRLTNPEQGHSSAARSFSLEDVMADITASCGVSTLAAPIGGFWGVRTALGTFNARILDAIYFAHRIKQVVDAYHLSGVVEIGGGAGLVAYYARRLGVKRYSIIDLPTVGAVQAFTLRNEHGLTLHGEPGDRRECVLIPACHFSSLGVGENDLLFNADSLPEIDTDAARDYLSGASEKRFRYLLSSNHEDGNLVGSWQQNRVFEMTKAIEGFSLVSRSRSWMRPGYVEELFKLAR